MNKVAYINIFREKENLKNVIQMRVCELLKPNRTTITKFRREMLHIYLYYYSELTEELLFRFFFNIFINFYSTPLHGRFDRISLLPTVQTTTHIIRRSLHLLHHFLLHVPLLR